TIDQQWIFLQHGATTGSVNDDGIDVSGFERSHICSCHLPGGLPQTRMIGKRATTDLVSGNDHIVARSGKETYRGPIDRTQHGVHHASAEECDGALPVAFSAMVAAW